MTVREYIGARYVPIFMGEWNGSLSYEPLSIVIHQGNSYTSRQHVPSGIDISNETYWALTGNYNAQVEQYRQEVQLVSQSLDGIENEISDINDKIKLFYFTSEIDDIPTFLSENPEGYLFVDSDVICYGYVFPEELSIIGQGGILSGTYTINGEICTDKRQIFDVNSNITLNDVNNTTGYPEWFGAKCNDDEFDNSYSIAKCISVFAETELSSGDYYIENTIEIKTSYRTVNGVTAPTNIDSDNFGGTRIVIKNGGINGISVGDSNNPYDITQIHINYITIINLSPDWTEDYHGLELITIRGTYINHVVTINFNKGFYIYGIVLSYISNSRSIINKDINDENRAYGFYCDCNAPIRAGLISPIASLTISDCDVTDLTNSLNTYGIVISGNNGIADFTAKNNIFSSVYTGIMISGKTDNEFQQDIFLCENIIDNVTVGIHLLNDVKVTVKNNWIALGARVGLNENKRGLWVENSAKGLVIFEGNTIKESASNNNTCMGVRVASANNITLANNTYINTQKALFIGPANNVYVSGESVFNQANKNHANQVVDFSGTKNAYIEVGAYGGGSWDYGITLTQNCEDIAVQPSRLPLSMLNNNSKVRYAGNELTNNDVFSTNVGNNIMILGNVV